MRMDARGSGSRGQQAPPDSDKQGFKSKRYRDKLRTEVKSLESLLPVDRSTVHRKLDSQTVYRLTIAYFRTKLFLQAAGLATGWDKADAGREKDTPSSAGDGAGKSERTTARPPRPHPKPQATEPQEEEEEEEGEGSEESGDHGELMGGASLLQALDGFLLVVTSDGTILFVSRNILHHLGFNQVDLMLRCIYGIIHPDDQEELKMVLEQTLAGHLPKTGNNNQKPCCLHTDDQNSNTTCRTISFLCRMKCFNGTTTGYLKMHCVGHMRAFPNVTKSQRTSNQVLFGFCRPFITVSTDPAADNRNNGFWTRHELDLRFTKAEEKIVGVLGYTLSELEGKSFYSIVHPEDLVVFRACHKTLIHTDDIQTMYFRVEHKDGRWVWLHTRGKVTYKNSKKCAILFTHCPVREEDSTYIQQEAVLRQRYAVADLLRGHTDEDVSPQSALASLVSGEYSGAASRVPYGSLKDDPATSSLHDPHGPCPSSWHTTPDRHSPVFPPGNLRHDNVRDRRKRALQEEANYYPAATTTTYAGYYSQGGEGYVYPHQAYPAHAKRYCGYESAARSGEILPAEGVEYLGYHSNGYTHGGYVVDGGVYPGHAHHNQPGYLTGTNIAYAPVGYDVMNTRGDVASSYPTAYEHSATLASYQQSYYSKVNQGQMYDSRKSGGHMSMPRAEAPMASHLTSPYPHHVTGSGHVEHQNSCKQMMVLPPHGQTGGHQVPAKIQYIAL